MVKKNKKSDNKKIIMDLDDRFIPFPYDYKKILKRVKNHINKLIDI
jgi:hypothetical protein